MDRILLVDSIDPGAVARLRERNEVILCREASFDGIRRDAVEADAVIKGQTASSSYKPAILDNGVRIMVPPFIGAGTRIVVDVYEQEYVRRAE